MGNKVLVKMRYKVPTREEGHRYDDRTKLSKVQAVAAKLLRRKNKADHRTKVVARLREIQPSSPWHQWKRGEINMEEAIKRSR